MEENNDHFFEVDIDLFNGPIDLLLHLVKKNELEIEKLSLARICSQYLHCIEHAKRIDLELAAEYLVIAATLLSIKSSLILNEPVELVEDEEGNLLDPHAELLEKLKQAAIYKDGAKALGEYKQLDIDTFATKPSLKKYPSIDVGYANHDVMLLSKAFKKLLDGLEEEHDYIVNLESISVVDRMIEIVDLLKEAGKSLTFERLIPDVTSRMEIIASFISLLELCKRQIISIDQEVGFEEIFISLIIFEELDVEHFASDFDIEKVAV